MNNPYPRFSKEYWQQYARQITFLPVAMSNGKAIYRARVSEPQGDEQLQQFERWELQRKIRPRDGVGALVWYSHWALPPELYAYPYVDMWGYPVAAADPGEGPEGTVFFTVGKYKYWRNPLRGYAMAKFQMATDPEPPRVTHGVTRTYELADFESTPRGLWYPRLVKENTAFYNEQEGRPAVTGRTLRFRLDFKAELPEHLFEPK